jgi:hypothetical protein
MQAPWAGARLEIYLERRPFTCAKMVATELLTGISQNLLSGKSFA